MRAIIFSIAMLMAISGSPAQGDQMMAAGVQLKLRSLGLYSGEIDGRIGPASRSGITAAAERFGFPPDMESLIAFFADQTAASATPLSDGPLKESVESQVKRDLRDPWSAQFRNLRVLESGLICGEVNAKNAYGAYTGFEGFTASAILSVAGHYMVVIVSAFATERCLLDVS